MVLIVLLGLVVFLIFVAVAVFLWFVSTQRELVNLDEKCNNALSQIKVQLNSRWDALLALAKSASAYAKHESETLIKTIQSRQTTEVRTAGDVNQQQTAFNEVLGRLMAVREAYPELKANTNFVKLQEQLQDVEDKIQAARRFYNAGAKELNTKILTFPTNLINNMVGHFKKRDYFEVEESEKAKIEKAPDVKF